MGLAKSMMMEQEERGYGRFDETVCSNCVETQSLKDYIVKHGSTCECSYCKETTTCIDVEDLMGVIMDGVRFEYEKAVNSMGREDGEYIGSKTWDTYDLICDELCDELDVNEGLLADILNKVHDETWCKTDPYRSRESDEHRAMWDQFCSLVKNSMRYVFFRFNPNYSYPDEPEYYILDHIGEAVTTLHLFQHIPAEHVFYRGRMHPCQIDKLTEEELCSPSREYAKANRMSAEGISVFYAANDTKTAIAEIYTTDFSNATVAQFQNTRDLLLLDLSMIDDLKVPSLFDKETRALREPIKFLLSLNSDLSKPIERMKSIEYIPAQIVTEYFRFLFSINGNRIDGIAYGSSKSEHGICYVLFFDHEQCLSSISPKFFGDEHKQEMRIIPDSISTYSVRNDVIFEKISPSDV